MERSEVPEFIGNEHGVSLQTANRLKSGYNGDGGMHEIKAQDYGTDEEEKYLNDLFSWKGEMGKTEFNLFLEKKVSERKDYL